jgi:hypothetical protein
MTLMISLDPDLEKRLITEASREGVAPDEYARRIIQEHLPPAGLSPAAVATLKILDDWERENATNDPEQIARNQREGEEFMQNLARNRIEMEGPNARKLWP